MLDWVDRCCDTLFDVEHQTACRRLLAAVAAGDPVVFRRKGRPETAAATVCWLVAKANDSVGPAKLQVQELMRFFGASTASPSQRASVMLCAIGLDPYGSHALGSPEYLTARRRREVVTIRDLLRSRST
ncbi:DUF6398 domain-containing protein [Geodermatophilus sp. SYSU D00691]